MYIDLGSVSEDILKDGKKEFENGLNTPNISRGGGQHVGLGTGAGEPDRGDDGIQQQSRLTGLTRTSGWTG